MTPIYDGWTESEINKAARKARFEKQMLEARMTRNWYDPNSAMYDRMDQVMEDMIAEENEELANDAKWLDLPFAEVLTDSEQAKADTALFREVYPNCPVVHISDSWRKQHL